LFRLATFSGKLRNQAIRDSHGIVRDKANVGEELGMGESYGGFFLSGKANIFAAIVNVINFLEENFS